MPVLAGKKNADAVPLAAASTASSQSFARPVSTSVAAAAWLTPLTTFEVTITWWRGSRSLHTPPTSRNKTVGT